MTNIVVFASGSGSNFQAILNAIEDGQINGVITGMISNNDNAKSIERAKDADIPYAVIVPSSFGTESDFISKILEQLNQFNANLIVYTGFNASIPIEVLNNFSGRVLNIHPSLKSDYTTKGLYGAEVQNIVLKQKDKVAGCTVYLVEKTDGSGKVLGQASVELKEHESAEDLYERVRQQEFKLYPVIIRQFIEDI